MVGFLACLDALLVRLELNLSVRLMPIGWTLLCIPTPNVRGSVWTLNEEWVEECAVSGLSAVVCRSEMSSVRTTWDGSRTRVAVCATVRCSALTSASAALVLILRYTGPWIKLPQTCFEVYREQDLLFFGGTAKLVSEKSILMSPRAFWCKMLHHERWSSHGLSLTVRFFVGVPHARIRCSEMRRPTCHLHAHRCQRAGRRGKVHFHRRAWTRPRRGDHRQTPKPSYEILAPGALVTLGPLMSV